MSESEIHEVKPTAPATEHQMSLLPPGREAAARAMLVDKLGGRSRARLLSERFGVPLAEPDDAAA